MTSRAIEDEARGQANVAVLDPPATPEGRTHAGAGGGADAARRALAEGGAQWRC